MRPAPQVEADERAPGAVPAVDALDDGLALLIGQVAVLDRLVDSGNSRGLGGRGQLIGRDAQLLGEGVEEDLAVLAFLARRVLADGEQRVVSRGGARCGQDLTDEGAAHQGGGDQGGRAAQELEWLRHRSVLPRWGVPLVGALPGNPDSRGPQ